jgi:lipopolysaccharide transport system ATP-binding protein
MSDIAIKVENLGKRYRIGSRSNGYRTLRDTLANAFSAPFRRWRDSLTSASTLTSTSSPSSTSTLASASTSTSSLREEIWALKDVSFEVHRGEVVGIIGRNGAGKSTLLKILSRITEPTEGYAEIRGRVGTLLEVGTGFHAELSGRENIYLSGAILGMRKAEIERKFDEIVAFAEIEKFLDTPVKHYSSGMYVRLAFAVAAHLDPEILLVDEVLAVGDAAFQKKCLGKMKDVAKEGRTVLFVSHQMAAVKSLCGRAIQIRSGIVVEDGDPEIVVNNYFSEGENGLTPERVWDSKEKPPGNSRLRLKAIRVLNASGQIQKTYRSSQPINIEFEVELFFEHSALCIGFDLIHRSGAVVFRSSHNDRNESKWPKVRKGINRLKCIIPASILNYGTYFIAPKIGLHSIEWIINGEPEVGFEVQLDHSDSAFWNVESAAKYPGVIAPCLSWEAVTEASL